MKTTEIALSRALDSTDYQSNEVVTFNSVLNTTGAALGAVLFGGAVGWFVPILALPAVLIGLVLGIVNAVKKVPSPVLVLLYSLTQGVAIGAISFIFELKYSGIVVQTVAATLIVFGIVWLLFRSGKYRSTPRMTKIVIGAMLAYFVFCLVNLGLGIFLGVDIRAITFLGIPLGLIIGLFAVLLCTYSLVLDFEAIDDAIRYRMPVQESWRLSFGLIATLVWLYIELLRIISYLRDSD